MRRVADVVHADNFSAAHTARQRVSGKMKEVDSAGAVGLTSRVRLQASRQLPFRPDPVVHPRSGHRLPLNLRRKVRLGKRTGNKTGQAKVWNVGEFSQQVPEIRSYPAGALLEKPAVKAYLHLLPLFSGSNGTDLGAPAVQEIGDRLPRRDDRNPLQLFKRALHRKRVES